MEGPRPNPTQVVRHPFLLSFAEPEVEQPVYENNMAESRVSPYRRMLSQSRAEVNKDDLLRKL